MAKRGRPSRSDLAMRALESMAARGSSPVQPIETTPRIQPTHDLPDEMVEIWVATVDSLPADHFHPSHGPMLAQYCRHIVQARKNAELLERACGDPKLKVSSLARLQNMQASESKSIAMLATKLRLTPQSTTNHRGNKLRIIAAPKPWDE